MLCRTTVGVFVLLHRTSSHLWSYWTQIGRSRSVTEPLQFYQIYRREGTSSFVLQNSFSTLQLHWALDQR